MGYCQGMNFVAATMLLTSNQCENAFVVFKKPLAANADHFAHGRHFQAACHLFNWRCEIRKTWVRGLQWKAGAPPDDWEENVLEHVVKVQRREQPPLEVHDSLADMLPIEM